MIWNVILPFLITCIVVDSFIFRDLFHLQSSSFAMMNNFNYCRRGRVLRVRANLMRWWFFIFLLLLAFLLSCRWNWFTFTWKWMNEAETYFEYIKKQAYRDGEREREAFIFWHCKSCLLASKYVFWKCY